MRFIYFLFFTSLSISSFASTGKTWFDAPLDDCFEAIEKGKFLTRFNTKVTLVVPLEYRYPDHKWKSKEEQKKYAKKRHYKTCGVDSTNYFYDDREYSLNRVRNSYKSDGNTYSCPKLDAESYSFCEYAKHKNVKGVRPVPRAIY